VLQIDRRAVPLEEFVGADGDADEQIARRAAVFARAALPPEGDRLAVVDAGGDGDGELALTADAARAAAALRSWSRADG